MNRVRFDFDVTYTGEVNGSIRVGGEPPPHGEVTIVRNIANGDVFTTISQTNPDGTYSLPNLPAGPYELTVTAHDPPDGTPLPSTTVRGAIADGQSVLHDVELGR